MLVHINYGLDIIYNLWSNSSVGALSSVLEPKFSSYCVNTVYSRYVSRV